MAEYIDAKKDPHPPIQRGTGHRVGTWPKNTPSTKHLLGARAGSQPSSAMELLKFVHDIRDQGMTETCVGQALARALHVRLCYQLSTHPELKTTPPAYPSALGLYQLAVQAQGNEQFGDNGSDPALAVDAASKKGIPREDVYPFPELDELGNPKDKGRIISNVPLDVLEQATDYKLGAYYLIDSEGEEAAEDAKQALANHYPITLAVDTDDAFRRYHNGAPSIQPPSGQQFGGHDIVLVGYENDDFWGVNSWGSVWGIGGLFKMSRAAVIAAYDKFVIETVPLWPERSKYVDPVEYVPNPEEFFT